MFIQVLLAASAYVLKKRVQLSEREPPVCDNENQQNIQHGWHPGWHLFLLLRRRPAVDIWQWFPAGGPDGVCRWLHVGGPANTCRWLPVSNPSDTGSSPSGRPLPVSLWRLLCPCCRPPESLSLPHHQLPVGQHLCGWSPEEKNLLPSPQATWLATAPHPNLVGLPPNLRLLLCLLSFFD